MSSKKRNREKRREQQRQITKVVDSWMYHNFDLFCPHSNSIMYFGLRSSTRICCTKSRIKKSIFRDIYKKYIRNKLTDGEIAINLLDNGPIRKFTEDLMKVRYEAQQEKEETQGSR